MVYPSIYIFHPVSNPKRSSLVLLICICNTWPIILHLFTGIFVLQISLARSPHDLFVMWLCHEIPSIVLKNCQWKTFTLWQNLLVFFHVSLSQTTIIIQPKFSTLAERTARPYWCHMSEVTCSFSNSFLHFFHGSHHFVRCYFLDKRFIDRFQCWPSTKTGCCWASPITIWNLSVRIWSLIDLQKCWLKPAFLIPAENMMFFLSREERCLITITKVSLTSLSSLTDA